MESFKSVVKTLKQERNRVIEIVEKRLEKMETSKNNAVWGPEANMLRGILQQIKQG